MRSTHGSFCVGESQEPQEPGTSPEGPVPRSEGVEEAEENAERTAEPTEASAPEVLIEPQEPRADCCPLREQKGALKPASWLKETPNSWQGLEPFDSLDSERCRKGRPYPVPPVWRGCQDRSERGSVVSSCRTSTRGTRPAPSAGGPGERALPSQPRRFFTGSM